MTPRRCLLSACLALAVAPAHAAFHLWDITEVYSNADGTVQFIELFTTSNSQHVLAGHTLVASSDGVQVTFDFVNLPSSSTGNRSMLLATPGFAGLTGAITPDYEIPEMFFDPGAASITLNFAESQDVFTFDGAALPVDGVRSLLRDLGTAVNSPENFAGEMGRIELIFAHGFED